MLFNGHFSTEEINLQLPRYGRSLNGLRIVQLSDLHIKHFGVGEKALVSVVNDKSPDYIFLTGDMIPEYASDYSSCLCVLSQLKSVRGIYAVLGNSDHMLMPKSRFEDFIAALRKLEVVVLCNANVQLSHKRNKVSLVGVDDPFFQFDNFDEAITGLTFSEPTILLSHSPDILFRRGDALVVNLLETNRKKEFSKTWGWASTTYFSPESGELFFERDGNHTIRIQSRQDGVSLDTVLLNPYSELDELLRSNRLEIIDEFLKIQSTHERYADLVVIHASMVNESRCYGKWKKRQDRETLFGFRMDDMPARRSWRYQPLTDPVDYFDVDCSARSRKKYRLWMRMKALKGNPCTDSVYVQFSDSMDGSGKSRYRIGTPASSKLRLGDVDLILTGHTHGGQIRLPFYGAIETMTSLGRKYAAGLHRIGKTFLYISRGVGCSRVPIRFLCPPEVTVFNF